MKKFLTLVCMITCIFGLTACGSNENLTEYEQIKVSYAEQYSAQTIVPILASLMSDEASTYCDGLTMEEIEYYVGNDYQISVDGYAFSTAVGSFHSAAATVGEITDIGDARAEIDGSTIVVEIDIKGTKKDAKAEVILSNDLFMRLESAALNPVATTGEMMGKAALNTVIGMGTVFIVLILISLIISGFSVIPKLQKSAAQKKADKAAADTVPADNAAAAVEPAVTEDVTDDLELVAVIAAAVAASQGAASTDGFVVRSVIRRR